MHGGYSLRTCDSPIKAVFKLIQDKSDLLLPLSELKTSRFLTERVMEVCGFFSSSDRLRNIFSMASRVARSIPGYELHVRKSPDFWKLIDAEFQAG
jgi:hypothetical protein